MQEQFYHLFICFILISWTFGLFWINYKFVNRISAVIDQNNKTIDSAMEEIKILITELEKKKKSVGKEFYYE